MTDEVQPVFGEGLVAGQPSGTPIPAGDAAEPKQEYLTKDEAKALFDQYERRIQALTDKQESRLKKEVDGKLKDIEKRYTALGLAVPPDVRQKVINEAVLSYADDEPQPAQAAPADALVVYVNRRAAKIAEQAGVTLEKDDPEYRQVKFQTDDPDEFLESWSAAVQAKAERTRAGSPGATAPMLVQGKAAGGDLRQQYERAKALVRPGSEAMLRLRQEYRLKGLTDI